MKEEQLCTQCNNPTRAVTQNYRILDQCICVVCQPPNGTCPICQNQLHTEKAQQCPSCKSSWHRTKADIELKKTDVTQQKELTTQEVQERIELIVKAVTPDDPIACTFVKWGVEEKQTENKGSGTGMMEKVGGMVLGAAVGGPIGEMVFGGSMLSKGTTTTSSYSGWFGVLVVTSKQILVHSFKAPFDSIEAKVFPHHLDKLLERVNRKVATNKLYDIANTTTKLTTFNGTSMDIVCGNKELTVAKADIHVKGNVYYLPSIEDIHKQIIESGSLAAPEDFYAKLIVGDNPIQEDQFNAIDDKEKYLDEMFNVLVPHSDRDALFRNFSKLIKPVRMGLESRMRQKGQSYDNVRISLYVCGALSVLAFIGILAMEGFLCFLAVVATIGAVVASIVSAVKLSRSNWCRKLVDGGLN